MKRKKESIECGFISGFPMELAATADDGSTRMHNRLSRTRRAWARMGPHAEGGKDPAERVEGLGGSWEIKEAMGDVIRGPREEVEERIVEPARERASRNVAFSMFL